MGSGAFGEVFEGRAKGLTNSKQSEMKVAVKVRYYRSTAFVIINTFLFVDS